MDDFSKQVEFRQTKSGIKVYYDDDEPPFSYKLMGTLIKDRIGYFRFHPAEDAIMLQKHFRIVGDKLRELNSIAPEGPGNS